MRSFWTAAALLLGLASSGCELADVTATPSADLLVVDAVLEAGSARQIVLLHRALDGEVVRGELGARVVVEGEGSSIEFNEAPLGACTDRLSPERVDSLTVLATCYFAILRNRRIQPGGTYELLVETAGGERVRGRTTVPGRFQIVQPEPFGSRSIPACVLPPNTNLPVTWTRSDGALSYLAGLQVEGLRDALAGTGIEAPSRLELTGVAVGAADTVIAVPRDFGIFDIVELNQDLLKLLQHGFPAGVVARVVVSAIDRNFLNALRGGGFNPSGPVRVSSVTGDGVGVFGSVVTHDVVVAVGEHDSLPPCIRPGNVGG